MSVTKLAWLLKTAKQIIKKPKLEVEELNYPSPLCSPSRPPCRLGEGSDTTFQAMLPGSCGLGRREGQTVLEEDCGGEGGVGESKCRSSVPALSARHSPSKQLLIFIEIELVYSIILVLGVEYND